LATTQNILVLISILRYFDIAFGLKVNYLKIRTKGSYVSDNKIHYFAEILNSDIIRSPFTYLVMVVGGNHRKIFFWDGLWPRLKTD